jgi:integrase
MHGYERGLATWYPKIRKRGDWWFESYTYPGRERSRRALHTRDRETAATNVKENWERLDRLAALEKDVAAGLIDKSRLKVRTQMTLLEAAERYMVEHGDKLPSAPALKGYNAVILEELRDTTLLSAIDAGKIGEFLHALERRTRPGAGGKPVPLAEGTINHHLRHLRAMMKRAHRKYNVDCDPHGIVWEGEEGVMLPEPDAQDSMPTDEQIALIRDKLASDTIPIFEFSLETGLRQANVYGLLKTQVASDHRSVTVRVKSKLRDRRKGGVSGKVRTFPLSDAARAIVGQVWDDHPTHVFSYSCERNRAWIDPDTMQRVAQRKGQRYPFTKSLLRDRWDDACKAAGVEGLTWHMLRAACATRLLDNGVPIDVARDLLGHSSTAITERYLRAKERRAREWLDRVAGAAASLPPAVRQWLDQVAQNPATLTIDVRTLIEKALGIGRGGPEPNSPALVANDGLASQDVALAQTRHTRAPPQLKIIG